MQHGYPEEDPAPSLHSWQKSLPAPAAAAVGLRAPRPDESLAGLEAAILEGVAPEGAGRAPEEEEGLELPAPLAVLPDDTSLPDQIAVVEGSQLACDTQDVELDTAEPAAEGRARAAVAAAAGGVGVSGGTGVSRLPSGAAGVGSSHEE